MVKTNPSHQKTRTILNLASESLPAYSKLPPTIVSNASKPKSNTKPIKQLPFLNIVGKV
jgi:hypothetical protein